MEYPGVFCKEINLDNNCIESRNVSSLPSLELKNGVLVELFKFSSKRKITEKNVENLLLLLRPDLLSMKSSTLRSRLKKIRETQKKFEHKKKVPAYDKISEFHNDLFLPPLQTQVEVSRETVGDCLLEFVGCRDEMKCSESEKHVTESTSTIPNSHTETETQYLKCPLNSKSEPIPSCVQSTSTIPNSHTETETQYLKCPLNSKSEPIPSCVQSTSTIPNSHTETETQYLKCPLNSKSEPIPSCVQFTESDTVCSNAASETSKCPVYPVTSDKPNSQTSETAECPVSSETTLENKHVNLVLYHVSKQQKVLNKLKSLVKSEKDTLEHLKTVKGHFSIRNVTKRDENAQKTRKNLREAQKLIATQRKQIDALTLKENERKMRMNQVVRENEEQKNRLHKLEDVDRKKINAQKLNSYYRNTVKKLRDSPHAKQQPDDTLKTILLQNETCIEGLTVENETLKESLSEKKCRTKNEDGTFTDRVRLCVMELFGLEIATEKIPLAIETVSRHMFSCHFEKLDLPNPTSVQRIVDEGHFLAKTYIADQIEQSSSFGINRDGTTRRKEKIVDTSVTLDSGDVISLGFTKVARETAAVINEVTKRQMEELSQTNAIQDAKPDDDFIARSLEKLAFTMSDRASNEKLADKLLSEWRDDVLNQCHTETQKTKVLHFHCMAHVLLGFHRYVCDDLKKQDKKLTESTGPIGRDSLPVFKFWSKKKTVAERVAYTTSSVFGPVGDHLGARDRWEAYCASKGIRSLIGNYKDNRFNGLFQTAAEIYLHREDFIEVLGTIQNPNLLLKSVLADLESETVQTMLQCLALLYVKVTGPYWWLVTDSQISYLELYTYVQSLASFLKSCEENPKHILNDENGWLMDCLAHIPHEERFTDKLSQKQESKLLLNLVRISCGAMLRTVEKQLADFLPGGQFSTPASKDDLERTAYAQVTNLGCEHHFGDLDSSQKRRPNASFHHHSSVQLIKRNRRKLFKWIGEKERDEQTKLLKSARKGGQDLRKKHKEHEKEVMNEIERQMNKPPPKRRRIINNDCDLEEDYETQSDPVLPKIDNIKDNEYVVVAYQDAWYPGCVVKSVCKDTITVNFMVPCRKPGTFMWPARKDVQTVEKQFVLKQGLIPECCNSGRQWFFREFNELGDLYSVYKDRFFC